MFSKKGKLIERHIFIYLFRSEKLKKGITSTDRIYELTVLFFL